MKQLITLIALLIIANTAYTKSTVIDKVVSIYPDYTCIDSLAVRINSTLDSYFTEDYFYIIYSFSTNKEVMGIAMGDFKQDSNKVILLSIDDDNIRIEAKPTTAFDAGIVEKLYNSINDYLLQNIVSHSLTIERQDYREENVIFSSFKNVPNQQIHSFVHFSTFYFGQKYTDLHQLYIICYDILTRLSEEEQ